MMTTNPSMKAGCLPTVPVTTYGEWYMRSVTDTPRRYVKFLVFDT